MYIESCHTSRFRKPCRVMSKLSAKGDGEWAESQIYTCADVTATSLDNGIVFELNVPLPAQIY